MSTKLKTVFFFQAEDGIRDGTVTGVQTCALPICAHHRDGDRLPERLEEAGEKAGGQIGREQLAGEAAEMAEQAGRRDPQEAGLLEGERGERDPEQGGGPAGDTAFDGPAQEAASVHRVALEAAPQA